MTAQHYTATFTVAQFPEQVIAAVTNPRGWWSEDIVGATDSPGAEFQYHYRDVHRARIKITDLVPGKKVVWHVVDNYFNFVDDRTEWIGTDVVFEIGKRGDQTELRFTHVGLVPAYECYTVCADAWGGYVKGSLRDAAARDGFDGLLPGVRAVWDLDHRRGQAFDRTPRGMKTSVGTAWIVED